MNKCNCEIKKNEDICCCGCFKAISDPNRLKILQLLKDQNELCVCKIYEELNLAQNLASHHLKVLSANGIVKSRRVGKNIYYKLNNETINNLSKLLKILNK